MLYTLQLGQPPSNTTVLGAQHAHREVHYEGSADLVICAPMPQAELSRALERCEMSSAAASTGLAAWQSELKALQALVHGAAPGNAEWRQVRPAAGSLAS